MKMRLVIMMLLVLSGCSFYNVTVLPKPPYPYSFHQENKTCDWYLYHLHYEGGKR